MKKEQENDHKTMESQESDDEQKWKIMTGSSKRMTRSVMGMKGRWRK